jgi:GTP pyrophosphokinase
VPNSYKKAAELNPEEREPIESVLARFDERKERLEAFCDKTQNLIEECLQDAGIRYQSVQARVKKREKIKEKYLDETKGYKNLDDITDQAALRVITYYDDEVDRAAEVIRREFSVDRAKSVDKRETESDRFGYYALNFVCSHLDRRTSAVEYKKFVGTCCEIQVTSILRHAWSEIEHDWYDLKDAYPEAIKRRFYRLAALLEIAESEFLDLRKSKANYRQSAAIQVEARVPDLPLDPVFLKSFLEQEPLPARIDQALANLLGYGVSAPTDSVVEMRTRHARAAGFTRLKDLADALTKYEKAIVEYVAQMLPVWEESRIPSAVLERGVCIWHLSMMLLANKDESVFVEALKSLGIPLNSNLRKQIETARGVLAKYS